MADRDFHFDFNEDAEPVEELHRLRAAMTKHFTTSKEHWEYLRATPTVRDVLAELAMEIRKKETKPKAAKKNSVRRKASKRLVSA